MPRRKKSTISKIPQNYRTSFFAIILLFFWVLAIIWDDWKFWIYLHEILINAFWEYYKAIFSPATILAAIFLFKEKDMHFDLYRAFGLVFYLVSVTTLVGYFKSDYVAIFNVFPILKDTLWANSTLFAFLIIFFVSLFILFRFSVLSVASMIPSLWELKTTVLKEREIKKAKALQKATQKAKKVEVKSTKKENELSKMLEDLKREKEALKKQQEKEKAQKQMNISQIESKRKIKIEKKSKLGSIFWWSKIADTSVNNKEESFRKIEISKWEFPSIDLLDDKWGEIQYDKNEIRRKELEIEEKLLQFKIQVSMEGYKIWPTVIQYRLKPMEWVKLQKIVNLKKDLTLALKAKNIRIQAPIPWLGVVWIEVPNDERQIVWLKEIIVSKEFNSTKLSLPIAIWKDINGWAVVWDLAKMPHLLVAGQTASWKSVWMNGFLISLLYKFSPNDLKFIMVDPKRVELSVYNGIPHLLTPVITNPDKALNSLKWCVAEMLRRYDLATAKRARNFKEYNDKVSKEEKLPYIVIVIDELADLMMSGSKKEVESNIARISQMARAVWMHLIIATQRPSVDVITWLIKANVPSRIAFTVSSQIDSRTVIDKMWAEDLLGMWDMLYYPTWALEPERVQWVFVETHEVESVVNQVKLTIDPDMLKNLQDDSIVNWKSNLEGSIMEWYNWEQDEDPEIIEKAMLVVKEAKKGSTSLVQRKLWLGYARAAKILDILEDLWVVWPANGSKPREVYID